MDAAMLAEISRERLDDLRETVRQLSDAFNTVKITICFECFEDLSFKTFFSTISH